jgi:hypothetical protein
VFGILFDLIKKRFRREVNGAALKAASAVVVFAFVFLGAAGLLFSLFLALEPSLGPLRSALSVSGVAFVFALLASTPLWWPKRRPPPRRDLTLVQLIALASKTSAAGLSARQLAYGGVLIALALGLATAKPPAKK